MCRKEFVISRQEYPLGIISIQSFAKIEKIIFAVRTIIRLLAELAAVTDITAVCHLDQSRASGAAPAAILMAVHCFSVSC